MKRTPKSISGLTSAAAARVMLWQSGEEVTVPGNAMGLQLSDPFLTSVAGQAWVNGDILYADGADDAARLPIGGTGMHLTVVGGVPVWAEPSTKFVASGTFSGAEDDIDLSAFIAQGYKRFKVMWSEWEPNTSNEYLRLRFSLNAGSSFQTTGYGAQLLYLIGSTPTTVYGGAGLTDCVQLTHTTPSGHSSHGYVEFHSGATYAEYFAYAKSIHTTGPAQGTLMPTGHCVIANANAIRFLVSSGNHGAGKYSIHALKDF